MNERGILLVVGPIEIAHHILPVHHSIGIAFLLPPLLTELPSGEICSLDELLLPHIESRRDYMEKQFIAPAETLSEQNDIKVIERHKLCFEIERRPALLSFYHKIKIQPWHKHRIPYKPLLHTVRARSHL